jgi:hypothetical protein
MTVFKLFAIIFRCCPYQSFLVCLRSSHIIVFGGLTLVTILGKVATLMCVAFGNFVAMGPTVIIKRRRESFASSAVITFLLEQSSEFFECLSTFFQFVATIPLCTAVTVPKFVNASRAASAKSYLGCATAALAYPEVAADSLYICVC